jgi:hypothetical protein
VNAWYFQSPKADVVKLGARLQAGVRIFDHLRRGAERTCCAYPYGWEEGLAIKVGGVHDLERFARFAACRARQLAESGEAAEAVRVMMDVLQLGRDMIDDMPEAAQARVEHGFYIALLELKDLVQDRRLASSDLERFAAELERIDRHFPDPTHAWLNEVLLLGYELLKPASERVYSLQDSTWEYRRYSFCRRVAEAEAFERVLAGVRKAASYEGRSSNEEHSFRVRLATEVLFPRNPIVDNFWNGPHLGSRGTMRALTARLRLLRTGAHYRATGDDEGVGWLKGRPRPVPGKPPAVARDVVLEVDR